MEKTLLRPKTPWEFKWLYKYLDRQAVMRKLGGLPTEGLECELKRMRAAIRAGTTCYVSYRRGSENWRWSVRADCLAFAKATEYPARSWDPIADGGPRFGSPEALARAKHARVMREQVRKIGGLQINHNWRKKYAPKPGIRSPKDILQGKSARLHPRQPRRR